jgi:hypothetical protein
VDIVSISSLSGIVRFRSAREYPLAERKATLNILSRADVDEIQGTDPWPCGTWAAAVGNAPNIVQITFRIVRVVASHGRALSSSQPFCRFFDGTVRWLH